MSSPKYFEQLQKVDELTNNISSVTVFESHQESRIILDNCPDFYRENIACDSEILFDLGPIDPLYRSICDLPELSVQRIAGLPEPTEGNASLMELNSILKSLLEKIDVVKSISTLSNLDSVEKQSDNIEDLKASLQVLATASHDRIKFDFMK
jgi:hypothetical protein